MTKEEAIKAMSEGKKVRHRYFGRDEWVTMKPDGSNTYILHNRFLKLFSY